MIKEINPGVMFILGFGLILLGTMAVSTAVQVYFLDRPEEILLALCILAAAVFYSIGAKAIVESISRQSS